MNKQVSQDGKSFSLDINSSEFSSVRVPVCYVSFPNSSNQQFDASELVQQLGKINLSINVDAVSYYNRQPDVTITNKVVSKQIEVPQNDVNFNPCLLDLDKDGTVSINDIEEIYSRDNVPKKFDIDGDGVVTDADRLLAREYVGFICSGTDDNDVVLYEGVYDHIPDMKFGYSVNRLLRGGHSTRPLFRVYMPVNYFTNHDFSFPNAAPSSGYKFLQDRSGSFFMKEPSLIKFYQSDNLIYERGEILVQDIYWTGSEENLKSDIGSFYALGKQMQEANGINPDENFYDEPGTKAQLSSVRVSAVYDQSGNNKHAYSRFYYSGESSITSLNGGQIIMTMGNFITNDDGRLALSTYGYLKDNPNPFGVTEGSLSGEGAHGGAVASTFFTPTDADWDEAYKYAPLTEPNEPVYMYTVKDYTAKKKAAPYESYYGGAHDAIDNLQLIAEHYGFNSFQDIFDGEYGNRLKTEFTDQIPENQHLYQYNRAIFIASSCVNNERIPGGGLVYSEYSGNSINLNSTGYPYYISVGGDNYVPDAHPGWSSSSGVTYENIAMSELIGNEDQKQSGKTTGAKDIYMRLVNGPPPNNSDYNRRVGFNKYVDDQTIVTSLRYHDDNFVSGVNPRLDFRINNKKQIYWGPNDASLDNRPYMLAPRAISINGGGNEFYEMVGFKYHDEESYESVISDANEYFGSTPIPDASHAPTPES